MQTKSRYSWSRKPKAVFPEVQTKSRYSWSCKPKAVIPEVGNQKSYIEGANQKLYISESASQKFDVTYDTFYSNKQLILQTSANLPRFYAFFLDSALSWTTLCKTSSLPTRRNTVPVHNWNLTNCYTFYRLRMNNGKKIITIKLLSAVWEGAVLDSAQSQQFNHF